MNKNNKLIRIALLLFVVTGGLFALILYENLANDGLMDENWQNRQILAFKTAATPISEYSSEWILTANDWSLDRYGLSYPVTYSFRLADNSSPVSVFYKYQESDAYLPLTEKSSSDIFNGIDAVRFDYAVSEAFVSIAFGDNSNSIYLLFEDSGGIPVQAGCLGIPRYYDNRDYAVFIVCDDIYDSRYTISESFLDAFIGRELWLTAAVITGDASEKWTDMQSRINRGDNIEVASHSRTHPAKAPYNDYDSEIGGSRDDIIGNLNLDYRYSRGNSEYVWAWVAPSNYTDTVQRAKMGEYDYLVDRSGVTGQLQYSGWDDVNDTYHRTGIPVWLGDGSTNNIIELNYAFDRAKELGAIYSFYTHPQNINDRNPDGYFQQHLDYVDNRTDGWYTGLGSLYMYRYVADKGVVTATAVTSTTVPHRYRDLTDNLTDYPIIVNLNSTNFDFTQVNVDGNDLRFIDGDNITLLPYFIADWDVPNEKAVVIVRVPEIPIKSLYTDHIYMYWGNPLATDNQSAYHDVLKTDDANVRMNIPFWGIPYDTWNSTDPYGIMASVRTDLGETMPIWSSVGRYFNGDTDVIRLTGMTVDSQTESLTYLTRISPTDFKGKSILIMDNRNYHEGLTVLYLYDRAGGFRNTGVGAIEPLRRTLSEAVTGLPKWYLLAGIWNLDELKISVYQDKCVPGSTAGTFALPKSVTRIGASWEKTYQYTGYMSDIIVLDKYITPEELLLLDEKLDWRHRNDSVSFIENR